MVTLEEAKLYLKIDQDEEDGIIRGLLGTAGQMVSDLLRTDAEGMEASGETARTAVLYATAYLYEHREEADYRQLMLSLRAMLSGRREVLF